jgi:hypothetical protein
MGNEIFVCSLLTLRIVYELDATAMFQSKNGGSFAHMRHQSGNFVNKYVWIEIARIKRCWNDHNVLVQSITYQMGNSDAEMVR